jgi:hypothetical protein
MRFSTASTTPSFVSTPMAVEPSCRHYQGGKQHVRRVLGLPVGAAAALHALISTHHRTLIASIAYSTWNRRPSGLNVFTPRSYSLRVRNMTAGGCRGLWANATAAARDLSGDQGWVWG